QAVTQWNVTQKSNLLAAESIAVDGKGVVYVTDGYGTVGLFDPYGNWAGSTQGVTQSGVTVVFSEMEGVAANSSGTTWIVADWVNGQVFQFLACAVTLSPTPTPTFTMTPTGTRFTPTLTPTNTLTFTLTPTFTPSPTGTINTPTFTITPTPISNAWAETTSSAPFSNRTNHASVFFNNQIWVIGGQDSTGARNDVWYSGDGTNWKSTTGGVPTATNTPTGTVTPSTPVSIFSPRYGHQAMVFKNKMWVIGGYDGTNYKNDVWSSWDGKIWSQATTAAGFSTRAFSMGVSYNNNMWVIGGQNSNGVTNDVWYSSDGMSWTQATASAAFAPRKQSGSAMFNNKLWVIGGFNGTDLSYNGYNGTNYGDVWSSSDGVTWSAATTNAGFVSMGGLTSVPFGGQLYLIAGWDYIPSGWGPQFFSKVWLSSDGANWTLSNSSPGFSARPNYSSVASNNQ
ncbi:MAG TPA: hypothetical protein VIJ93_06390, partial [bacterium]